MNPFSRRRALQSLASGFGYLAFAGLAQQAAAKESSNKSGGALAPKATHFAARAKRVIFLCMNGGPSHVDTFDYKPALQEKSGTSAAGTGFGSAKLLGSPFKFQQHGSSGLWISEVLPHLAKQADELCVIRSMHTDLPNHAQAFTQLHTGSFQFVRPSVGAWSLYGLGSENENLPGFLTINPPSDNGGARNYGSGFLPAICQGTKIGGNQIPGFYAALLGKDEEPGPPLKNLANDSIPRELQRAQLDFIRQLNEEKLKRDVYHPEIEGAIESFELAFRMQGEVPEVLDLRAETAETLKQYGVGAGLPTDRFGRQCILARRLAEAGVRFIEITAPTQWDHHFLLKENLAKSCLATDQPAAALIADLKQRGMLDDTLVIWAGEFGRTPYGQSGSGRDHNNKGYTLWMAGGGVKRCYAHGATDEFGYQAVEQPVHIHDWHATVLHLLGLDHERLTFNYGGRDFRLTDVYGDVVSQIIS
ncbi:hypothetical protein ETAA8_49030 [Anatilimnocola aggregata]|uniref:DUF1501 domain-containing protein n=1 Tax=Anatilimnocola aggregata TaxID=2528021 RepID=A0A517YHU1_9BACT|nr:DUF1501 domain-containing protein [Anatilimnocola aggregata]QDU29788.1 hypothetical protein ETAA8_49030 [Anatilimnocola aggregata]